MNINQTVRKQALTIIDDRANRPSAEILKAIFDLSHNAEKEDEAVLYELLEHNDDSIVASAIFSLFNVFGLHERIKELIHTLALGDSRDRGDMPIQSTAIRLLGLMTKSDSQAYPRLRQIAESPLVGDVPKKEAWKCLADYHGLPWTRDESEILISEPEGDQAQKIRRRIREVI
jgi:HEAT repeat protein